MARRTIFGPDMGISGWTPIDDDQDLPFVVRPVAAKDQVLPKEGRDSYVDIGNGMYAPASGYAVNQSFSNAGNSPEGMDSDWQIDAARQRMQALGLGYTMPRERAREIVNGSPEMRLDGFQKSGNGSNGAMAADDGIGNLLIERKTDGREKNTWLDYIASREAGGAGYNAVLGNGAYGMPSKNISDMTLNEVMDYQRKELLPNARRGGNIGQPKNSSAVGRYQIVNRTLNGLVRQMGLSGNEKFSPEMQDRMAWYLTNGNGRNVQKLRNEWDSFKRRPSEEILRAYDQGRDQYLAPVRSARQAAERRAQDAMVINKMLPIRSDSKRGFNMFKG